MKFDPKTTFSFRAHVPARERTVNFLILFLLILAAAPNNGSGEKPRNFEEGDIIFQTSMSSQSQAIQLATHSPYSHMGVLFKIPKE